MCTLAAIGSLEIPRTPADLPENAGTKNSILRILHFLAKLVLKFGSVSICLAQIDRLPKSDRVRPLKSILRLSIQTHHLDQDGPFSIRCRLKNCS